MFDGMQSPRALERHAFEVDRDDQERLTDYILVMGWQPAMLHPHLPAEGREPPAMNSRPDGT
jgi:hypothetical protein